MSLKQWAIVTGDCKEGMKNMIELSVIIPMYNSQNTIRECLNSICINKSIEVILVDDGSTDQTSIICNEFCENNSKFKYIFQENSGPGAARNLGINNAQGNYIMFLDSDDYLDGSALEDIIDTKLSSGYDIIYYNFEQIDENGNFLRQHRLSEYNEMDKQKLINSTLSWKLPWGQFKLISSDILGNGNIRFAEDVKDSEELIFTIACLENADSIFFCESVVYKYVKRSNSLSTSHDGFDLYQCRASVISSLKDRYGNKYQVGIYNYTFVTYIQLLKLFAEQSKGLRGYNLYCNRCKKEAKMLLNKVDIQYFERRYKVLYTALKLNLDLLLYFAFKFTR
ncbi:glycosyltransferase family 2 protein [Paenibacillus germinis]|uniref:glycosyltransferase family 2 protein n=1 Tax=Paenibacillus germinis TaxID=2654979 RepID=UPI0014918276|nr:glycosyltransferase family 2 protein [Paenibacillus germinis]